MISPTKVHEVHALIVEHGIDKTAKMLGITRDSVERYERIWKSDWMPKVPKVLVFDLETLPNEVYSWRVGRNIFLTHENIIRDGCMLSYAARWLFSGDVHKDILTPEEVEKRDDSRIAKSLWKLIDEAHVVIAHYGKGFDKKKMNTAFKLAGLNRPSPYQMIDTKYEVAKNFSFLNNTLDNIARQLGCHRKIDTHYELWLRCLRGEQDALDEMLEYNVMDVFVLEDVYMELRGWIDSHPNLAVYCETDQSICPTCTSEKLHLIQDVYGTPANAYEVYRCEDCGAIVRTRKSKLTKDEKEALLRSIAR
jgi:hypothetical protein